MSSKNVTLPDSLNAFMDERVSACGYSTSPENVPQLIREDQDCLQLRGLLSERYGPDNVPSESSIKLRLAKIWPHVKPDIGRPSAVTAVNGMAPRPPGKGRPLGR